MLFCDTDNRPPWWFYVALLFIVASCFFVMAHEKEIIKFWMGL